MSDYRDCAELCEEYGFLHAARWIREVGEGTARVFLVWPTDQVQRLPADLRRRWSIHVDRAAAQDVAIRENVTGARYLRTIGPYYDLAHRHIAHVPSPEFLERVRQVLGPTYWFPRGGNMPLFPRSATDEQLRALLPLLRFRFYEVIEVPLVCEGE